MSLDRLIVDGQEYAVVGRASGVYTVSAPHWLTTLLLAEPAKWAAMFPQSAAPGAPERVLLSHGRNTYGYLSEDGAWLVCGPWPGYVQRLTREAVRVAGLHAAASVRHQWRYVEGRLAEVARTLATHVAREIPGWHRLPTTRRRALQKEVHQLVERFLAEAPGAVLGPRPEPLLEPYAGTATVPAALAEQNAGQLAADAIEAQRPAAPQPHREALDYWWQSVFTMWWKGFW